MIDAVVLRGALLPSERRALRLAVVQLQTELSCEHISAHTPPPAADLRISMADWEHDTLDVLAFDRLVHYLEERGNFRVALWSMTWGGQVQAALQLLNRYQRLLPLSRRTAPMPQLHRVLALHRGLHAGDAPLVRADLDHALDTWRWLLRLKPQASPSLQLAALFHDVERLESESRQRVEHRAADYLGFKLRHARRGASLAACSLAQLGLEQSVIERAVELIALHEQPQRDPELALLNDCDALSFFSLNSWGYLRYFGPAQTRRKVEYTLSRMSAAALPFLGATRQPPLVAHMLRSLLGRSVSAWQESRHG